MEAVRTDKGGEFMGEASQGMCRRKRIKQKRTTANNRQFDQVAERALDIIEQIAKAERIEALLLFPGMDIPGGRDLRVEAMIWACGS